MEKSGVTTEVTESAERERSRGAVCELGQRTIMREHTIEMVFTEVNYSERRKIEVKRRCIAANDDGFLTRHE